MNTSTYLDTKQKLSSKEGMTMLETVVAVLILAVFMAGVASLISQSGKVTDLGRAHYVAVTLCRNRLETARTLGTPSLNTLTNMWETNFVCNANGGQDSDGMYMRITAITTNYLLCTNLTEVKVTVMIKDRKSLTFSNEYESVQSIFTGY
jgi:Tfp pilus assembly protein PilV